MKTITITKELHSYSELTDCQKRQVFENWQDRQEADECLIEFQMEEMLESMKALAMALETRLIGWEFGPCSRSYKARIEGLDENNYSSMRGALHIIKCLKRKGYERPGTFKAMSFPGVCGLTGTCYDDDFAESLYKDVLSGQSIKDAFDDLARKAGRMLEDETEYLTSKKCFLESLDESEEIYAIDECGRVES
jgi:hypothetical protein